MTPVREQVVETASVPRGRARGKHDDAHFTTSVIRPASVICETRGRTSGGSYTDGGSMDAVCAADWWSPVVAEITSSGAFGRDCGLVSFEPDGPDGKLDQFASTVLFGTASVGDRDGLVRRRRLVFKVKHRDEKMRAAFRTDVQFHNETWFYEKIMPFLVDLLPAAAAGTTTTEDRALPFCRYIYGRNECGDRTSRDTIVLENACTRGYRTADERMYLDFDHLVVALRTLAKFHALSYRAKQQDPERFIELVSGVRETHLLDDQDWMIRGDCHTGLLTVILNRLAERRGGDVDERARRRFRTDYLSDALNALRRTMIPAEPLAVLCHGDFNRNNLLFRYDDAGRPVDALPIDLATVRYGSPALDLSFFLYMNTDRQTRDDHWDRLLDAYCAALAAAVSDVADTVRVPDRERMDAEFRDRAFYGLTHVTFFVPIMLAAPTVDTTKEFLDADDEDLLRLMLSFGGDQATDVVADAVQHYIDIAYTDVGPKRLTNGSVKKEKYCGTSRNG